MTNGAMGPAVQQILLAERQDLYETGQMEISLD
jgi:hypothetical protein